MSSCGDASEEEDDQEGIFANLVNYYEDDEDQEKDSKSCSNEPMESGSETHKSTEQTCKMCDDWTKLSKLIEDVD